MLRSHGAHIWNLLLENIKGTNCKINVNVLLKRAQILHENAICAITVTYYIQVKRSFTLIVIILIYIIFFTAIICVIYDPLKKRICFNSFVFRKKIMYYVLTPRINKDIVF